MGRREFLQYAAGGLALSVMPVSLQAADGKDLSFSSQEFNFSLRFTGSGEVELRSLRNARTGFEWAQEGGPFHPGVTAAGATFHEWKGRPGARKKSRGGERVEISALTPDRSLGARIWLQSLPDAPILELQTEFQNVAKIVRPGVTSFGCLRIPLRNDLGKLRVYGIRRNEYGLKTIPVEGAVELSGGRWNAPEFGGLLLLEAVEKQEFLLLGIEWERGWRYRVEQNAQGAWLTLDLADLTHDLAAGERFTAPRVFLGVTQGDHEDAFLTARHYMQKHVFLSSLPNWPWVVYDFWATDGQGVEEALLREIEFSKTIGVDILVYDASWYAGSSTKGTGDWGCGLGNYQDDRKKFPGGLAAISRKVHEAGMKFGLWVGPNVVDSRLVGVSVPKPWLVTIDGKERTLHPDGWESSVHQVCLGARAYIDFLKKELVRVVRDYQVDWLKWDNSGIPGSPADCTRADHGHQAGDGSYASLVGQYEIFEHLHAAFPNLVLEQCGYGSRLDYGLARTIRANWLSDASYPSEHVRNNAMLANYLYPSAYNGGWIVVEDKALLPSVNDPVALDTIFRSRMMCLFGYGTINGQLKERISLFPESILQAARRNVAVYKRYRHLLLHDCYHVLAGGEKQPEAVQFVSPSAEEAVVLAFRAGGPQEHVQMRLRALQDSATYELEFVTAGRKLRCSGAELAGKGMEVTLPAADASEVVLLRKV
ncbi:MAG: alpha-galactosidase [Acidobacteria bacterium]|nr:alpha-galactosidase [Acidobacteriota bacterium]